ncbi:MAG: cyclodeaminase/cyclohydrolase family protein, partial [Candidatus Bipolaricaulia bacterium]
MTEKTLGRFLEELSSAEPTPGGGAAAALVGSLAASLVAMVAGLTIGKRGYEGVESTMREV